MLWVIRPEKWLSEYASWSLKIKRLIQHFQNGLQEDCFGLFFHFEIGSSLFVEVKILELQKTVRFVELFSKLRTDRFDFRFSELSFVLQLYDSRVVVIDIFTCDSFPVLFEQLQGVELKRLAD